MKSLDIQYLKNLSFPDSTIKEMITDKELRILKIKVDTAWLDKDGGVTLNNGEIIFSNWEGLECQSYNKISDAFAWVQCKNKTEVLKDICEFQITGDKIILRGFGKSSGFWTEITIINCKVAFNYND